MNGFRNYAVISTILVAAAAGCGDNTDVTIPDSQGQIEVLVGANPGEVTAIHISVTGNDFPGSVDADLVEQPDQTWLGTVLDVPPGTDRTVTAEAFDASHVNTFQGVAKNVTVSAGDLTDISLTLEPTGNGGGPGIDTPPHFTSTVFPASILSTETATMFATAADPDANTQLTYSWSVLQGGGTLSDTSIPNQPPGTAVSTVYTPQSGFTGFALIQVSVTDGTDTTTTTFPIAVGAGLVPQISFDVLPDLSLTGVERQTLFAGDTTQITYTLTNPVQPWTPATMHVRTAWRDACGGSFDAAPEDLDINQGDSVSRTLTYSAPGGNPASVTACQLSLTLSDANGAGVTSTVNTWIDPSMVMFQSSASVPGNAFNGEYQAADAFCQGLADAPTSAVPAGTYHALIAFDAISTKDRLIDAPYSRVDGTPIARNKYELYSLSLLNAIRTDENNAFNGVSAIWTGTNGDGTKGTNCNNWTSTSGGDTSTAGINATSADPNWTNSGTFTCSAQLPIYCVQQPGPKV